MRNELATNTISFVERKREREEEREFFQQISASDGLNHFNLPS